MDTLSAAGGLKHNEAGRPNWLYELNPDETGMQKWFNLKNIERDIALAGGKKPERIRLARYGVHGDGSCAYHTLCAALNYEGYNQQTDERQKQIAYKFRCSFGDKLNKERVADLLKKVRGGSKETSVTALQDSLCDPKVWADETALRLVAETLDLNLIFIDMDKNAVYCGMHHDDAVKGDPRLLPNTIVVLWVSHSHFEPLAHLVHVGPRVTEVKILLEPSKSEVDARLVQALMAKYQGQCKLKRK